MARIQFDSGRSIIRTLKTDRAHLTAQYWASRVLFIRLELRVVAGLLAVGSIALFHQSHIVFRVDVHQRLITNGALLRKMAHTWWWRVSSGPLNDFEIANFQKFTLPASLVTGKHRLLLIVRVLKIVVGLWVIPYVTLKIGAESVIRPPNTVLSEIWPVLWCLSPRGMI